MLKDRVGVGVGIGPDVHLREKRKAGMLRRWVSTRPGPGCGERRGKGVGKGGSEAEAGARASPIDVFKLS